MDLKQPHEAVPRAGGSRTMHFADHLYTSLGLLSTLLLGALATTIISVQAISIKPNEFERLIMPCYLGGGGGVGMGSQPYGQAAYGGYSGGQYGPQLGGSSMYNSNGGQMSQMGGRLGSGGNGGGAPSPSNAGYQQPAYYGASARAAEPSSTFGRANDGSSSYLGSSASANAAATGLQSPAAQYTGQLSSAGGLPRDSLTGNLGQTMPRANTIENFIALVNKIEVANPRLANNPDALIRSLLSRFRLDNYYYDVRSRTPIADQDRRVTDILPALMGAGGGGNSNNAAGLYGGAPAGPLGETLALEQALDQDEKCSMYFMLSHFIDKTSPAGGGSPPLGQMPLSQLAGPLQGQRPPSLQAAGAGYPGASANFAYSGGLGAGQSSGYGGGSSSRGGGGGGYPGPSPSFGSPQTANMNSFGAGISVQNPELASQRSPYGVNSPAQSPASSLYAPVNSALASPQLRNPNAAYPAAPARAPYIDASATSAAAARPRSGAAPSASDDRLAMEYGVVTTANQDNAALVLNRVLLGMLAATTPPQTIRQLASVIYPTQTLNANTPRLDEELDPLFAVTLADLWAVSALPKAGKPLDFRLLGDNGRWNSAMCPTSFTLERSSSIRFTTAELLGGLDGFSLGMFRRRLLSMRRNIRLSELLRIYYSPTGFRPQFPEIGVCSRGASLSTQLDDLHRQAENYLRLYQLSLPTTDNEIAQQIGRLDGFRELTRQAATNYAPPDICQQETGGGGGGQFDLYPMNGAEQCEISRADLVLVLDGSPAANQPFEQLVAAKLAQRIGLSRGTNSLTIMTNQQDTSGYAGAYSFNTIVRNSTNLGEIGCALTHDTSQSYQGGQVSDPVRLMEMFERALVNLDSEYLTRQMAGGVYSGSSRQQQQSTYVSTWFGGSSTSGGSGGDQSYVYTPGGQGGPRNTGGAKVIVWFNYGPQARPAQAASGPTNWGGTYGGSSSSSSSWSSSSADSQEYKFYEAKKYLRENFRGASILALSPSRDDVKAFVYDEERDIFTDLAGGGGGGGSGGGGGGGGDSYSSSSSSGGQLQQALDSGTLALLGGQADQLVGKLVQRMCTVPALFQYPMCFREPSSGASSAGYISPGRKQYWMMSPKSFFASRSVRLVFRVEGGRLRVCFGRKPNPDETAARYNQQNGIYDQQQQFNGRPSSAASFTFQNGASGGTGNAGGGMQLASQQSTTPAPTISSSDYYTGLEYGVCKEVAPGQQEIDFLISDPCYHKSIAECEPFYFVLRETSQPGEGDPNYMCRDEGCKRFDQAKFVMSHTGVSCSSATRGAHASWPIILISSLAAGSILSLHWPRSTGGGKLATSGLGNLLASPKVSPLATTLVSLYLAATQQVARAQQQAGVYDFGQNRYGEKRGNFTPSEVTAIILIVMLILGGLALTIALCYYVTKRSRSGLQPVAQDGY